jgi:ParB/RepB/Spo0J family partition protein
MTTANKVKTPEAPATSMWPVADLVRGKNPRTVFGAKEITSLSQSLMTHGMIEPMICRPGAGKKKLEIVAGERRWMAAKEAKMTHVPVIVRELSDHEALEIAVLENLQREDLQPIDEAKGFQMLIQGNHYSQEALAGRLGKTQSFISNRVRLLDLPKAWLKKIISGEISATCGRMLVPYRNHKKVLEGVAEGMQFDCGSGPPSVEDMTEVLFHAVTSASVSMDGSHYDSITKSQCPVFKPTEAQTQQLEIIEIVSPFGHAKNKAPEKVALNTTLWNKLQRAHVDALVVKANKKAEKGKAKSNGKPKKLTPAQQKAEAERQKVLVIERRKKFRARLWEFKIDWLRYRCSLENEMGLPWFLQTKVLLWMSQHNGRSNELADAMRRLGHKAPSSWTTNHWGNLSKLGVKEASFAAVGSELITRLLWFKNEPRKDFPDDVVLGIAADLKIDLKKVWKTDQAGPLTARYFDLHSKDQLIDLAKELHMSIEPNNTKSEIIAQLLASSKRRTVSFPKDLDKIKRG